MTLFYNSAWDYEMAESWDIEVGEPVTKCVADNEIVKVYELPAADIFIIIL